MAAKPTTRTAPRARLETGVLFLCAGFVVGCPGSDDVAISDVQVRPDAVVVRALTNLNDLQALVPPFRLHARLIDDDGLVRPDVERDDDGDPLADQEQFQLEWHWVSAADAGSSFAAASAGFVPTIDPVPDGMYADVDIGWVPQAELPLILHLRVTVAGEPGEGLATIEIRGAPPASAFDVQEPSVPFELPVIAAVDYDDGNPASPIAYEFGALVGAAGFPATAGTGVSPTRVTTFRRHGSADVRTGNAVSGPSSLPTAGMSSETEKLNTHVWLAVANLAGMSGLVEHEIRLVDSVLARNRVGIEIGNPPIDTISPVSITGAQLSEACARDSGAAAFFAPLSAGSAVVPDYNEVEVLNIVYVTSISGTTRAYACDHMAGSLGGLILVDAGENLPMDLGHEVGHALGLQGAGNHVDMHPELEQLWHVNMMSDLTGTWLRSLDQLTIGQAWRMNISRDSWINIQLSPPPEEQDISCHSQAVAQNCPDLATGMDHLQ